MKTVTLVAIVVVVAVVAVAGTAMFFTSTPRGTKNVLLTLDWMPSGSHLPIFVAAESYLPQKGINLTIVRGIGSADTAAKVGSDLTEFGVAAFDRGLVARTTKALQVKAIFSACLKCDSGFWFIKDRDAGRGVVDKNNMPESLIDKIYGGAQFAASTTLFVPLLEELGASQADIDSTWAKFINLDASAQIPAMLNGDIDMNGISLGDEADYAAAAAESGLEIDYVWYKDYGFELLGDTIWTSDKLIRDDPQLVRDFVESIQEAFVWTLANEEAAAQIFIDANPGWGESMQVLLDDFNGRYGAVMDKDVTAAHGVGYMPDDAISESVNTTYTVFQVDPDYQMGSPSEIFTNQFINSQFVPSSYPW